MANLEQNQTNDFEGQEIAAFLVDFLKRKYLAAIRFFLGGQDVVINHRQSAVPWLRGSAVAKM